MKTRTCWGCGRRRPLKKISTDGEGMFLCRGGCYAAGHRYEARIYRQCLGDHYAFHRGHMRAKLEWHKRCAERKT